MTKQDDAITPRAEAGTGMGSFDNLPPVRITQNEEKKKLKWSWPVAIGLGVCVAAVSFGIHQQREAKRHKREAYLATQQVRMEEFAREMAEHRRHQAANGIGFEVVSWRWEDNGIINTYCRPSMIQVRNGTDYDAVKVFAKLRAGGTEVNVVLPGLLEAGKTRTYRRGDIGATRIARTCRDATLGIRSALLAGGQ